VVEARDENGLGVDNKSSGTTKWKKKTRLTKNQLDADSKGGHEERRSQASWE